MQYKGWLSDLYNHLCLGSDTGWYTLSLMYIPSSWLYSMMTLYYRSRQHKNGTPITLYVSIKSTWDLILFIDWTVKIFQQMCAPVDKSGASVVTCASLCDIIFLNTSQIHSNTASSVLKIGNECSIRAFWVQKHIQQSLVHKCSYTKNYLKIGGPLSLWPLLVNCYHIYFLWKFVDLMDCVSYFHCLCSLRSCI